MAKTKTQERREAYAAARRAHREAQVEATEAQEQAAADAAERSKKPYRELRAETKAESLRRKREHAAAQPEEPPVMEHSERVALRAGQKAAAGPPENKAAKGPAENKALSDMTKAELYEVATEREIEGRSGMTKAELLKALK